MRDIKFRAYKPEHGDDSLPVMTEPFTLGNLQDKEDFDFTNGMYACWNEFGLEHKDCIVMQFTGLVDKNGVDIYEGDVVSHPVQGVMKVIYPMSKDFAGFGLESLSGRKNTLQDAASLYEVIGNIHENPIFRLEGNR